MHADDPDDPTAEQGSCSKRPVAGRIPARGLNLGANNEADLAMHGGPTMRHTHTRSNQHNGGNPSLDEASARRVRSELKAAGIDVPPAVIGEHWPVVSTSPRIQDQDIC